MSDERLDRAIEICADDLAVAPTAIQMLGAPPGPNYKSEVRFLGTAERITHVVKVDSPPYDPAAELESLEHVARVLGAPSSGSEPPVAALGVVEPVGCGEEPRFLVTRYQPGVVVESTFAGVVRGRRGAPVEEAREQARRMAEWLALLRVRGTREAEGIEPERFLEDTVGWAAAIGRATRRTRQTEALAGCLERYAAGLGADDLARMRRGYPSRGDARPKNFLFGDDGVLYAFDLEGFDQRPMEHDLACVHHSLEHDGILTPAAARRALDLWCVLWDHYLSFGSSPTFGLLGYLYFVLRRMLTAVEAPGSWRRRARNAYWVRNRLRWMERLTGDLEADARQLRDRL